MRSGMTKTWDSMTYNEKIETLRREMARFRTISGEMANLEAKISVMISDFGETWNAMRDTRSELDKVKKDVGTLKALWPYPQKKYSKAG
jgi:hypothetical protein